MSNNLLEEVAAAIADGVPIDWELIQSHSDPSDSAVIAELQTLSTLRFATRTPELPDRPEHEYWGHLHVLESIGRGAFGEVYRAWDTQLDREVALKLLPPDAAAAEHPGSSIIEEGRLLARVRHPNVTTIYGAARIAGRVGLWMELVHGRTLEALLREGKVFAARDVTRIGIDVCRAVSAVHAAGLLHRDIKAHNVMLADDGRIVLMDFGTSRELDRSQATIAGTPLYVSPEVLSGAPASPSSEVYSIGVLLYHLLTGAYPVHARDLADLRRAHEEHQRAPLRSARPQVSERLAAVIERAIDPQSARRYESADALRAALAATERVTPVRRAASVAAGAAVLALAGWLAWDSNAGDPRQPIGSTAPLAAGVVATAKAPAIVVLPFKNRSAASDSDDFVDGLTSVIIGNLAEIDGLQVRSQTSSFFFKNKPYMLRDVGEQLNVGYAVEGTMQVDDGRLRLNIQFVQIAGDVPLWSYPFDVPLGDVFAIQDEISRAIVNKLRLTLGRGQRRYQTNEEAYDLYLRALAMLVRGKYENGERAAPLLEQVVSIDPSFAPAYAGLCFAYDALSWQIEPYLAGRGMSGTEGLARMRPAAEKAIALDPLLAEAHAAMGSTYAREFDWVNAERSFQRAIALNPTLTWIHSKYAVDVLVPLGRTEDAERVLRAALEPDPLSLDVRRWLGFTQIAAGRYEDAIVDLRSVLAIDPKYPSANLQLARALMFAGRPAEAIAAREGYGGLGEVWIARALVMTGRRAEVERMAAVQEHPYRQALPYAALGEKDRTFEALDLAAATFPNRVALLVTFPEMAFLRGDPRFERLQQRFNLR